MAGPRTTGPGDAPARRPATACAGAAPRGRDPA